MRTLDICMNDAKSVMHAYACMAFSATWGTSLVLPTRFIHIYISINTTDDLHMQFDIAIIISIYNTVFSVAIDVVHKKQNLPLHFVERAAKLLTFLYKSPRTTHTSSSLSCMHACMHACTHAWFV